MDCCVIPFNYFRIEIESALHSHNERENGLHAKFSHLPTQFRRICASL